MKFSSAAGSNSSWGIKLPFLDSIVDKIISSSLYRMVDSVFHRSNITIKTVLLFIIAIVVSIIAFKILGVILKTLTMPIKMLLTVVVALLIFLLLNGVMS